MKQYSIALIDNMNNNFFALARYLRDQGLNTHLYTIPGGFAHFEPQNDTYDDVSKMDWLRTFPVSYGWKNFFIPRRYAQIFSEYDLIVACGRAMGLLYRYGIQPDVFIPFGSDLCTKPFLDLCTKPLLSEWKGLPSILKRILSKLIFFLIARWQRKSIEGSRVIITNPSHEKYGAALKRLEVGCLNINVPMLYNSYTIPYGQKINADLGKYDFIIFNHSRHIWSSNPYKLADFDMFGGNKRNDKVIKGFARFLRKTNFRSPILITFEYGPDVRASKQLIKALGIEEYVMWISLSPRKEIMAMLQYATFGVDQLRNGLSGIGGTGYEIMASGVPLITYTNGATSDSNHPFFKAPIVDLLEEDDLLDTFIDYEQNPGKYKMLGDEGKKWFDRNMGSGLAKKYLLLFTLLAKNKSLTQKDDAVRSIFIGDNT